MSNLNLEATNLKEPLVTDVNNSSAVKVNPSFVKPNFSSEVDGVPLN